jgi:hypothetical protein
MNNICVFCEGSTENNYIQALNRFLLDSCICDLHFTAKNLEGVTSSNCYSKIRKYKSKNLKAFTSFYAWLDYDIFKRASKSEGKLKAEIEGISFNKKNVKLILNYMNGEDFIILHENSKKIEEWKKVCKGRNHFENPMDCSMYLPLFKEIMPDYTKKDVPDITKNSIELCVKNIKDPNIPFKSNIDVLLEKVLKKISV